MSNSYKEYADVIVVGGGHAGIEAALASARMGTSTLLISMDLEKIGVMSCNPAIGGLAKGQLVKEIDALGGEMARAIDATGIQFRILNHRKGPAVRSSRAQADRHLYAQYMQRVIRQQDRISLLPAMVTALWIESGNLKGVQTTDENGNKRTIEAKSVILTPGTFLNGKMFIGDTQVAGGRQGEKAAIGLTDSLRNLGIQLTRLKTGTTPRLEKSSINFDQLEVQPGDAFAKPFSYDNADNSHWPVLEQHPCHITYTNEETHKIVRDNLHLSALFRGEITGTGPRYCPSLEDKIVRFGDRDRHQVFIEPEGLTTPQIYPNGISTSLPVDVQLKFLRTMVGLERVEIRVPGYAVEYDFADPTQLYPWLESKCLPSLFLAGQINGTSGYEEAAAQGLLAGINAALKVNRKEPLTLSRSDAYLGVLIDDLVTRGTKEPYRMFTSRAEYRLHLREDNADQRLTQKGIDVGLVPVKRQKAFKDKVQTLHLWSQKLKNTIIKPSADIKKQAEQMGIAGFNRPTSLWDLLKKDAADLETLCTLDNSESNLSGNIKLLSPIIKEQILIEARYEGYIKRQQREIDRFNELENMRLPHDMTYKDVAGLSTEAVEKFTQFKPANLGQASRISGATPAAITALMIHLKKHKMTAKGQPTV